VTVPDVTVQTRADFRIIADWIPKGSKVLDLGCGGGELLAMLAERRQTRGVGLERSLQAVSACISRGVSAYQGDLDQGLADLHSKAYDVVILNQTLQMVREPRFVMEESMRVGRRVIVGFPNFGYWTVRLQVLEGRTPRTKNLPFEWYNSPNFHFMSVLDFRDFARQSGMRIRREAHLAGNTRVHLFPNLRASASLFELEPYGDQHHV
jgi:methionine biosynthesis protein MetW